MVFTKEMSEIVDFFSKEKNYAIFGGFATEIYTNIESSPDIDVYIIDKKEIESICNVFLNKGWKKTRHLLKDYNTLFVTLEKNKTTLDLWAGDFIEKISIPNKERVVFRNKKLYCVCKEELFLEKMIGASLIGRLKSKQERDKKAVNILRKKLNPKKLKGLLEIMPPEFFTDE